MEQLIVNAQTGDFITAPMTPEDLQSIKAVEAEWLANQPARTKVFKADIWRRASEQEAEQIDAMLSAQTARLRHMWADASFLSTTDELFVMIKNAAVELFGDDRAVVLLEPTE